jgi:predicted Rossmann-fold nucleotide-binding protein
LNVRGYYDRLVAWLDHAVVEGFVQPDHRQILLIDRGADRLLERIARSRVPAASGGRGATGPPLRS